MKEYFDRFAEVMDRLEHDWDSFALAFAEEEGEGSVVKYCLAGFPEIEIANDPLRANTATFQGILHRYRPKLTYLNGAQTDCVFQYTIYCETAGGRSAFYSGHGILEFNEDGYVKKLIMYSEDSEDLANIIGYEKSADEVFF